MKVERVMEEREKLETGDTQYPLLATLGIVTIERYFRKKIKFNCFKKE